MWRALLVVLMCLVARPAFADLSAGPSIPVPIAKNQGGTGNANGWFGGTTGVLGSLCGANFNSTAETTAQGSAATCDVYVVGTDLT